MANPAGVRLLAIGALRLAPVLLSCLKPVVALLSPDDGGGIRRGVGVPDSLDSSIVNCVVEIIRAHRSGPPTVGVVFADEAVLLPHLLLTLLRPPESPVLLLAFGKRTGMRNRNPSSPPLYPRNMSHAVFLPSPSAPFNHLFERAALDSHWSSATMHLVVASTAEAGESERGAEVHAVLSLAWRYWVANIAVVVPTKEADEQLDPRVSVITHFPYSSGEICGRDSSRIREVAAWQRDRFTLGSPKGVYPEKFGDLHGCVVKATVFDAPPACIPKGKGDQDDEVARVDGLHGLLLAEAAKRMNFTTQINQFFPERYHILGEGFHHQWDCTTFAVPISHPGSSWRLIGLATPSAWMALIASIILSCTASWAVNKLQPYPLPMNNCNSSKVVIDALVAFVGDILTRPPTSPSSRVLFPAVCLGGLIATTAIRAHLLSLLSAPDTTSWAPSNLREMVESGMNVGGPMEYKFLAKDMKSKEWKTVLEHYELHDEGTEALDIDGVAVAGMRRNLLYRLSKKRREKVVLKLCPLPLPTAILLHKGSPFQMELKKIDRGLVSGGIIAKWMHDHTSKTIFNGAIPKAVKSGNKRKISVSEMRGVFILYSIGLLISWVTFIVEILRFNFTNKKPSEYIL